MRISRPWLVATILFTMFIWGNSLVPATGSSGMSLRVVSALRGALSGLDLPSAWITNFLVRKTAHFTEYAILGILVSQTLASGSRLSRTALFVLVVVLVLIPSIDETIQLFVPGRSGLITDVMLDCSGAAVGSALRALAHRLREIRVRRRDTSTRN
ncbi:VanZ family protein [Coriobacterium glomerans PW2]|uniref:VanZ family protein n=1 Tax=Coriobacterium glomerans (strain ATCC 49209 / DSM 20642 / JCM 10262 / PW2) TaxID=700015 RepID=F2N863_CORGP|nr:VanZ family protein [Coriobacterium glomerans]AEB07246.1 VanZ family protein [Coriobacterium glomerans PW2]